MESGPWRTAGLSQAHDDERWRIVIYCPPNYKEIVLSSVKLPTVKRGRDIGGIIKWYKEEISDYITLVKYERFGFK